MRFLVTLITLLLSSLFHLDSTFTYNVDGVSTNPEERLEQVNVPGMSVFLITDFENITQLNYGVQDRQSNRPIESNTLFQAGGLSNVVANIAAMIAVQEGKIELTKNINDYLKDWKLPVNKFQKQNPVTLEDLLLKRRGFKQPGKPHGYSQGESIPSLMDIMNGTSVANTETIKLRSATTTRDNYSFETEMVTQLLLEAVYDMPYADIVQEKIFTPLNMMDSFFSLELPEGRKTQLAHGYLKDGTAVPGLYKRYPETASCGLWTTTEDYGKLVIDLLMAASGKRDGIITVKTATSCFIPQNNSKALIANSYGPQSTVTYGGAAYGYRTQFEFFPDKGWGYVIMMNSNENWQFMGESAWALKNSFGI